MTNTDTIDMTTDIVPVELREAVIAGDTPQAILDNAAAIANKVKDVIDRQGFAVSMGSGRKAHVEVQGWQAAGAMLGAFGGQALHAETLFSRREDRDDEIAYTAKVEIKTLAGDVVGSAEGFCSSAESKWRGRDEYAIKGMAETRAEGRAYRRPLSWLVSMAGYSPALAEEVADDNTPSDGTVVPPSVPSWALHINDVAPVADQLVDILKALGADDPAKRTGELGQKIFDDCAGGMPIGIATFIAALHASIPQPETST